MLVVSSKIIVALDYDNEEDAWLFINKVSPNLCRLKIGKELFCSTGKSFVQKVVAKGFDVFLDLKFYDIPNTVASVMRVVADMGVWMVNVHASGGEKMMIEALNALNEADNRPLLIAVTVLTSMDDSDLVRAGIKVNTTAQVMNLAKMVNRCNLDGVVCSANEVVFLKEQFGSDFLAVTPGIRPEGDCIDDQKRIMTPKKAITCGSDYLVIGRPITLAENPVEKLNSINQSIL